MAIGVVLFAGRSGSKSLVSLLNDQPDTCAIWENTGFSTLRAINGPELRIEFLEKQPYTNIFDVDFRWLWHIRHIVRIKDAKIVYLHRDPEEITDSFLSYMSDKQGAAWLNYPFMGPDRSRSSILTAVKAYQIEVMTTGNFYKSRIMRVEIDQLNDMEKMDKLMDWLALPKDGRVLKPYKVRNWGDGEGNEYKDGDPGGICGEVRLENTDGFPTPAEKLSRRVGGH